MTVDSTDPTERDAIIAIGYLAALADGRRSVAEQEELVKVFSRLGGGDLPVEDISLPRAVSELRSPEARGLAYEMAVSVIYADGDADPGENAFLDDLKARLDLPGESGTAAEARNLVDAPLPGPTPSGMLPAPGGGGGGGRGNGEPRPSQAGIPALSHDAAIDLMIRQQALLAGALELLPQSIATVAIIPIQMRMVYRIGADYGRKLDADQIKDLLGAMGIGAVAQVLDGAARRLLSGLGRGLLGKMAGGLVGGATGMAAGAGLAFVTTYALGHAAKQYYAQGRRLSQADLRALFERLREEGEALLPQAREEIKAQSQRLDLGRLMATIRGTA